MYGHARIVAASILMAVAGQAPAYADAPGGPTTGELTADQPECSDGCVRSHPAVGYGEDDFQWVLVHAESNPATGFDALVSHRSWIGPGMYPSATGHSDQVSHWHTGWAWSAWRHQAAGQYGIRVNGSVPGPSFCVASESSLEQGAPDIAGGSVALVVWERRNADTGLDIYGRWARLNSVNTDCSPAGEFRINQTAAGSQRHPSVATASDYYVVVWSSGKAIRAQRFIKGDGYDGYTDTAVGNSLRINEADVSASSEPDVAMRSDDGAFVVVWTETLGGDPARSVIIARWFTRAGRPLTGDLVVNEAAAGVQGHPRVAVDRLGNWVVAWQSNQPEAEDFDIFARRFKRDGTAWGPEFRVNEFTDGPQTDPAVATDADGEMIIAWDDRHQHIRYRRYANLMPVSLKVELKGMEPETFAAGSRLPLEVVITNTSPWTGDPYKPDPVVRPNLEVRLPFVPDATWDEWDGNFSDCERSETDGHLLHCSVRSLDRGYVGRVSLTGAVASDYALSGQVSVRALVDKYVPHPEELEASGPLHVCNGGKVRIGPMPRTMQEGETVNVPIIRSDPSCGRMKARVLIEVASKYPTWRDVEWLAGESGARIVPWRSYENSTDDRHKLIKFSMPMLGPAARGDPQSGAITVLDDDPLPLISFPAATATLPRSATPLSLKVERKPDSNRLSSVPLIYSGSAERGVDYSAPDVVTFRVGDSTREIVITPMARDDGDAGKTIRVELGDPARAELGAITAVDITYE